MRVLVLGGTGLVGPHVVTRLRQLGHEVTVAHRGQTEVDLPPEVRHVHHPALGRSARSDNQGCLTGVAADLRRLAPEVVLDLNLINDGDARVVMATFRGVARRVVAVSSIDVYRAYGRLWGTEPDPPDPVPLREDAPLRDRPSPDRGRFPASRIEKLAAERVVLGDPELPGTVLRWPMVYGPRDGAHRLWDHLRRMDAGRPAILLEEGAAHWRWSRGYSENLAHAVVLATLDDRAAGRVYNVAEREACSGAEWVAQLRRATGWAGAVVVLPRERTPAPLRPPINTAQHWVVDTTRLREELGYDEPVPRGEALRRTIAWERANPPSAERATAPDYTAEDAALAGLTQLLPQLRGCDRLRLGF